MGKYVILSLEDVLRKNLVVEVVPLQGEVGHPHGNLVVEVDHHKENLLLERNP